MGLTGYSVAMLDDRVYDRDGAPITFDRWIELFQHADYKIVRQDGMSGFLVSTVWLGLDHGFGLSGTPVIFETMVFDQRGDGPDHEQLDQWHELDMRRYTTEADAHAGHTEIMNSLTERLMELAHLASRDRA